MVSTDGCEHGEPIVACPTFSKPTIASVETVVQRVTGGILDRFLPAPKNLKDLEDLLLGLKIFL